MIVNVLIHNLIRSSGGWTAVKAMRRVQIFQKTDERIWGDGDFVDQVLSEMKEQMEQKYAFLAGGMDVDKIAQRVSALMEVGCESGVLEYWKYWVS